jgi:hypothetical protein
MKLSQTWRVSTVNTVNTANIVNTADRRREMCVVWCVHDLLTMLLVLEMSTVLAG